MLRCGRNPTRPACAKTVGDLLTRDTLTRHDQDGFTLIEIALVIVLLVTMSALMVSRFDALNTWRQRASLRKFVNTWEFLYQQAQARGESYRLVLDFERNAYFVRREVPVPRQDQNVDHLAGLRLESEQRRLSEKRDQQLLSLNEEYAEEDARQGDALESLFFGMLFRDPQASYRLGVPLEFPTLKNEITLVDGLKFKDANLGGERQDRGQVSIRFSARGVSELAILHFFIGNQVMTAFVNPTTGRVSLEAGDLDLGPGSMHRAPS